MLFGTTGQDLRYATRMMRRRPAFTAMVVTVAALGIGANTTVFSILHTLFLKPLPYPDSDRLVLLGETHHRQGAPGPAGFTRHSNFVEWRAQSHLFDGMALFRQQSLNVKAAGEPERVRAERVSEDFFQLLGIQPVLGRAFDPADFSGSAGLPVVVGQRFWRTALQARPDVVGAVIRVEGRPATVIGVMPERFRSSLLEGGANLWAPLLPSPAERDPEARVFRVMARLKPGISLSRARQEMDGIGARLEQEDLHNRDWRVRIESMRENSLAAARAPVAKVLVMVVAILLLIACANVANLLLVRGVDRRQEIAVRLAMGARRARVVRQLILENLLTALAGGAAGGAVAFWSLAAFSRFVAPMLADVGIRSFEIDGRVLLFALALSAITGVLFGALPALRTSGIDLAAALKGGGRGDSRGIPRRRTTAALVTAELALSLVLLVAANVVLASVRQFWNFEWGFAFENRLVASVSLSGAPYDSSKRRLLLQEQVLAELKGMAGVRAAALAGNLPTASMGETVTARTGSGEFRVSYRIVSPEYFKALGIPLRKGRGFEARDVAESAQVAVVNETAARRLWGGRDPAGESVEINGAVRIVVGVAADIANRGLLGRPGAEVSVPYAQDPPREVSLLVHHEAQAAGLIAAIPEAVHRIDPDQPVFGVRSLQAAQKEVSGFLDFVLMLVSAFTVIALVLSAAGVYGVSAYSLATRTREIGIRMALGAARGHILSEVLAQCLRWVLAGSAIGAIAAFAVAKILLSQVWWLKANAVPLILPAAVLLGCIALLACAGPARRATRVNPAAALRGE